MKKLGPIFPLMTLTLLGTVEMAKCQKHLHPSMLTLNWVFSESSVDQPLRRLHPELCRSGAILTLHWQRLKGMPQPKFGSALGELMLKTLHRRDG